MSTDSPEFPPLPEHIGHLHSDNDFCLDHAVPSPQWWPVELHTADQMRAYVLADRALRPSGGQLQAKIDALMLEYCPDEMTEEQKANWAGHQVSAPVEISSCATCGHPVESGGERPAAAIEALRELVALKDMNDRLLSLHERGHGTDYGDFHTRNRAAWTNARAVLSASDSQESGSTECKESSPLSPASKGIDHE